ncbi:MAG: hypothetical protein ACR65R_05495 [Methylomicrobium sp.]
MERFERIYQLHHILSSRRTPIANRELQARLECSEITIKRLISLMRNHFDAPIAYSRQLNGYYYDNQNGMPSYELPGLWFNAEELWGAIDQPYPAQQIVARHFWSPRDAIAKTRGEIARAGQQQCRTQARKRQNPGHGRPPKGH